MATENDETRTPSGENESTTDKKAPAEGKPRARRARAGAKPANASKGSAQKAKPEKPAPERNEETQETDVVVRGKNIRNDGAETILPNVDVGPVEPETLPEAVELPMLITSVETITVEDVSTYEETPDLGAADMIVDMLSGLAEADMPPFIPEAEHVVTDAPAWYTMSLQVEDAQRAAAERRKAGRLARRMSRQVEKAARALQNVFEIAATDGSILTRHGRAVARLIALIEVTPPRDKDDQRALADIIRAERRALAEILRSMR